jgi:hypothetical protein
MKQLHLYFITTLNALTPIIVLFSIPTCGAVYQAVAKWRTDRVTANKSWQIARHHARSHARACTSTLQIGNVDINMLFSGEYFSQTVIDSLHLIWF